MLSFSEALHHELAPRGVRVTVLCPGPVPTEFQARAGITDDTFSPLLTRSAERVAREGYRGLKAGRRVVVPGFANKVVDHRWSASCRARCCSRPRTCTSRAAGDSACPGKWEPVFR